MSKERQHFLDWFLYPRNIAVVGASNNPSRPNFYLFKNLIGLGFQGKVYPVNPTTNAVQGVRAYSRLRDIEEAIDLVICAVATPMTLDVIRDCVQKKVKGVVIVSGGFSEIGQEGAKLQDEIAHLLKESGIKATGPNTLGPINTSNNLAVSFHPIEQLRRGTLSFIFQSGLYEPRLSWLFSDFHLGISKLMDLGNKMDVNETDALEYLASDPDTKTIAIHSENVKGDGRKFLQLLKETTKRKPVIILKSGRTPGGVKAAMSHTGSIVQGSDSVFDAALRQSGAIRAQGLEEFFNLAKAFAFLTPPDNNRILVATLPGGEGVIAADLCQQNGLSMAELSPETIGKLKPIFPAWEIRGNPFDLGVCREFHPPELTYSLLLDSVVSDENVDCVAVQLSAPGWASAEDITTPFCRVAEKGKPIAAWLAMAPGKANIITEKVEAKHIPVYTSAEAAIKGLSALYKYKVMQEQKV